MKQNYELKPLFVERMKSLLGKAEYERYKKSIESAPLRSIRVNTLKISEENLKKRLEKKAAIPIPNIFVGSIFNITNKNAIQQIIVPKLKAVK